MKHDVPIHALYMLKILISIQCCQLCWALKSILRVGHTAFLRIHFGKLENSILDFVKVSDLFSKFTKKNRDILPEQKILNESKLHFWQKCNTSFRKKCNFLYHLSSTRLLLEFTQSDSISFFKLKAILYLNSK